jgi:hypothetical protein
MSMKRMLLLASMALAAIAFAAPAAAQATVELTDKDEETIAAGAEITATSINLKTVTTNGTLTCGKVTLHFEVKENWGDTEHVVLDPMTTQAVTENCILDTGGEPPVLPVTIDDGTVLTPLTLNTWGTGYAGATFNSTIFGNVEHTALLANCHFMGLVHVEPGEEADEISITGSTLLGSGEGCAETGQISGDFTLEDENEDPVTLDYESTA